MAPILSIVLLLLPTQQGSPIVYAHSLDGGDAWPVSDIYVTRGSQPKGTALTLDGHSHHPSWSPDAQQILFLHDARPGTKPAYKEDPENETHHSIELGMMDADGANRRIVRRLEPVIFNAAWAPDGKRIAVSAVLASGSEGSVQTGIFLIDASGKGDAKLVVLGGFTPAWSPDGNSIAYSLEAPRGKWAVYRAKADGSEALRLTNPDRTGGSPAWSPDGGQIAFDEFGGGSAQQVFVMNRDGSGKRAIPSPPGMACGSASWSPDGLEIIYSCRTTANSCGRGVSSIGTLLAPCTRRIFTIPVAEETGPPREIVNHDGGSARVAPRR